MPGKEEPSAALMALVEAVEKDPELKAALFKDPAKVAAKFDVKFKDEEVTQLKRVGELMRLVSEFTDGRRVVFPKPIFYPIDIWWKGVLRDHILSYRPILNPLFYPIGYPIDPGLKWDRPGGMLRRR
jgi:hypothetical protein